jgi:hypothetical protein
MCPKCLCRNEVNDVFTGSRIITSTLVVYTVNKSVAGTAVGQSVFFVVYSCFENIFCTNVA